MDNQLFREKSMEQLSTPEQLTGYLKVTGPGVWFVLVGILVLLGGMFVWGAFGSIVTTVNAPAIVSKGVVSCYVLSSDVGVTESQVEIAIGDVTMEADRESAQKRFLSAEDDQRLYMSGYLSPGKEVTVLMCPTDLADGFYSAVVTTERLRPISLLFSKN